MPYPSHADAGASPKFKCHGLVVVVRAHIRMPSWPIGLVDPERTANT